MYTSIVIVHMDQDCTYHRIDNVGWSINTATNHIVIGKGLNRTMIPLLNVRYYYFERSNENVNVD